MVSPTPEHGNYCKTITFLNTFKYSSAVITLFLSKFEVFGSLPKNISLYIIFQSSGKTVTANFAGLIINES